MDIYGPSPASFLFILGLFKQTVQFLQQINVKKLLSNIWCMDLNPRALTLIVEFSRGQTRKREICCDRRDETKATWGKRSRKCSQGID